jgi:Na+/melibiose symporter-like transporter
MQDKEQNIINTRRGAYLDTLHMGRKVKVYAVLESEYKQASQLNTLATVFSSIGSFFIATAVSIVISCVTQQPITDANKIFMLIAAPVCFIIALGFYGGMVWAIRSRKSLWDDIGVSSTDEKPLTSEKEITNETKQTKP